MSPNIKGAAAAACLIFSPVATLAAPMVNFGTNEENPVGDFVQPEDFFDLLAGAVVTFNNQVTTWMAGDGLWGTGAFCGGAAIQGFSLGGCGDTFIESWYLDNDSGETLETLEVDLQGIRHFFDRTEPSPGSINSAAGRDFTFVSSTIANLGGVIDVIYSVPGKQTPEDLYKVLTVDFSRLADLNGLIGGLPTDNELVFLQDTDTVVPLPAAGWLMLTGGAALGALRRRRRA